MEHQGVVKKTDEDARLSHFRGQVQIGMELATAMLSRFLEPGHNFRTQPLEDENLPSWEDDQPMAGVCLDIEGAIDGAILLLFTANNACRLAGLLLRQEPPKDLEGDSLRSTLREIGNIFASGVLASLDDRMKLRALPSPPTFLSGSRLKIEEQCGTCCLRKEASLVWARFDCDSPDGVLIEGRVVFQLATESLKPFLVAATPNDVAPVVSS